jgi:hypothetical protein
MLTSDGVGVNKQTCEAFKKFSLFFTWSTISTESIFNKLFGCSLSFLKIIFLKSALAVKFMVWNGPIKLTNNLSWIKFQPVKPTFSEKYRNV